MKKIYEKADIEIVMLSENDLIVTSGCSGNCGCYGGATDECDDWGNGGSTGGGNGNSGEG